LSSPPPVENLVGPSLWLAKAPIVENEPSESIPDETRKVDTTVDTIFPSECPSSNDTIIEEKENDVVQILFINTDSDELGGSLIVPLPQEGSPLDSYSAIYLDPPPRNLVVFFN